MDALIGRDRERDLAAIFVAASASGPALLEIDGEPGIGKTTLFRYTVDLARLGGSTVLECSPTQAESAMSYVGLTDMLRTLPDSAFDDLPAPQRHSLEVATLRTAPSEVPLDERAVGTGLATLLTHLAESGAVILAVDDLQWLDRSSADVLTFAARRLTTAAVGILTCERTGESAHDVVGAVPAPLWRESITLTGLGSAVLFHVVRDQLGITLPRPALVQVTETSGGNPFAALALSRAVGPRYRHARCRADVRPGARPHRRTDERALRAGAGHVARCSLVATGHRVVVRLTGHGRGASMRSSRTGWCTSSTGAWCSAHPLLAAAVLQMASGPQQRAMHARLAAAADDPEARARHRALADPDRNEATAAALDEATSVAAARGSSIAAAELARLALDRTVDRRQRERVDTSDPSCRAAAFGRLLARGSSGSRRGFLPSRVVCGPESV